MLNKKWIFLVAMLMFVLNAFLLYKLFWTEQYYENTINNMTLLKSDQLMSYDINLKMNLLNDGINLENMLLTDSSNIKVEISNLFHTKDIFLVCRFSELHCQECVVYSIVKLLNQSKTIGNTNILFWGAYEHVKSLNIAKERLGIQNMSVYNISNLNIPAEEIEYPYYFVIDKTLRISNLFVPNKSVPDLANSYLKTITNRYFINDN
jgi:hypothetical protein